MSAPGPDDFSAVILAGGAATRLGGLDKAALLVDGRSLLDHALEVVEGARETVVAGSAATVVPADVRRVSEVPPRGGPAAGVLAGVDALAIPVPWVCVVAVDMPRLTRATIGRLRAACAGREGAVLVDPTGRRHLAAVVSRAALAEHRPPDGAHGLAWRRLLDPLDLAEVPARHREGSDVDTPADLAP